MKRFAALASLTAVLLSGCAAVPKNVHPEVVQTQPGGLGLADGTVTVDARWWTAFNDPQLNALVDAGLARSPTLDAALAQMRAAQAMIGEQRAGLLPHVNGAASVSRAMIGDKLAPAPIGGDASNISIAGASLSWDLDLFGKQRAAVRQASASADAARLDVATARLALSTSIAQTYVGLAQAEQQIRVADGFVQTREQALGLAQSQVRNKLGSDFQLAQANTLLAQARQARTEAVQQRDVLVHAIAALVGRGADFYPQVTAPTLRLDQPPTVPELLPADLLGRRPDLLAGQARIEAAVQGRAVAKRAFMPDINITALAGLASMGLGNFFTGGAGSWGGGPALSLPIFEGGKLRAEYKGATADLDEAVATYNGGVLTAVRDASDAITDVRAGDQDLAQQAQVVAGLRETVRLDKVRTRTGLGSQLDAIDSGFRLLQSEQQLVGLQAAALTHRIQLVAALGGGFDPARPLGQAQQQTEPRS